MAPDESKQSAEAKAEQAKIAADLETVLREALKTATTSLERYTDYAIKATKRVIEADAKPEDWSKDAAEVGALWLKDVTNAWSTWAKSVNLLAGRSAAGNDEAKQKGGGVSDPVDTRFAVVRLWAQTTADLIDVAQACWNGLINLNPAERDTMSAACEGSTVVPPQAQATGLGHSDFIDAHGNVLPNAMVQLVPDRIEAGTGPTEVRVRVAPDGVHEGRYTAVLLDDAGAPIGSRFSVYMAG